MKGSEKGCLLLTVLLWIGLGIITYRLPGGSTTPSSGSASPSIWEQASANDKRLEALRRDFSAELPKYESILKGIGTSDSDCRSGKMLILERADHGSGALTISSLMVNPVGHINIPYSVLADHPSEVDDIVLVEHAGMTIAQPNGYSGGRVQGTATVKVVHRLTGKVIAYR